MRFIFICSTPYLEEYSLLGQAITDSTLIEQHGWVYINKTQISSPKKQKILQVKNINDVDYLDFSPRLAALDVGSTTAEQFITKLFSIMPLFAKPFIPCIVVHQNGTILGLTYVNKESILYSLNKKTATFWSRDTNKIWIKGLTSGQYFTMNKLLIQKDNIIYIVSGKLFCHFDKFSCFNMRQPLSANLLNFSSDLMKEQMQLPFESKENLSFRLIVQATRLWGIFLSDHLTVGMSEMIELIAKYCLSQNISIKEIIQRLILSEPTPGEAEIECWRVPENCMNLGCSIPYFSADTQKVLQMYNIVFDTKDKLKQTAYFKTNPNIKINVLPAKPKDIHRLINYKVLDLVICNEDVLQNYPSEYVSFKLPIGSFPSMKTKIALIGKATSAIEDVQDSLIFSEYITITEKWLAQHNISANTVQISGAAEGFVVNGICDFCVCIVYSGATIAQNGLKIIDILYESNVSMHIRTDKAASIMQLIK
jgi:ATP phosphoribosyltransferase